MAEGPAAQVGGAVRAAPGGDGFLRIVGRAGGERRRGGAGKQADEGAAVEMGGHRGLLKSL